MAMVKGADNMSRQGLMDDSGYREIDNAEMMAEKYCCRCVNQPIETDSNGNMYALECDKDCSLANPKFFEREEE